MFSNITIASSTTNPTASTIPRSVNTFTEKSKTYKKKKAPIKDIGIVITGIIVARALLRNTKITITTSNNASNMTLKTELIAAEINSEVSTATFIDIPSGNPVDKRGTISRTACARANVLPVDCFTTPKPSASSPETLTIFRFSYGPGAA